ncbi:MAG: putative HTH-type transcriptional regulator [Candidatus Thorarchaeota archaeon]|nr:MAG: putative HTH-type transcriptional regulator [Candidatus Thorarchaeota archaeon]
MDQLDRDLIRILQKDARISFTDIAEKLDKADTTIHFRTKRLKSTNVITRFSALVKPEALGYHLSGLFKIEIGGHILPDISQNRTHTFAEEIAQEEHCLWVAVDNEPMTIHALILAKDEVTLEEKAEQLRKSPDVVKVSVNPLKSVVKGWEISGNPE